MINLLKLLQFWDKPKTEQTDIRPSERHEYKLEIRDLKEKHAEEMEWMNNDRKFLRCCLDAQIIELAKLKSQIAKKAIPKKRKKK